MKLSKITSILEDFAPLSLQESYDNAGLLTGNAEMEISSALLSIDITEEVIDEAIEIGSNLIISHHPLVFKGLKSFKGDNLVERCLIKAIKNDIALYSSHTNIDSVEKGVSYKMCEKLKLINCSILEKRAEQCEQINGFGMIGELEEAVESLEFLNSLKSIFGCTNIRHSEIIKAKIKKVAVCGGSGSFLINKALNKEADIFITGDIKYHDYFTTEQKIIIADIGHYESEQFTKEIFYELITKIIPTFAVRFSKVNTNPINYI